MLNWTETHTKLQNLLKKEIEAMRSLLGNMHQEELLIVQKETTHLNDLMLQRATIISNLSAVRLEREKTTEQLETMGEAALENLLPPDNINSVEILSLREQLTTLLDRINLQSSRNEMLIHLQTYQPLPKSKSKISIATYEDEEAS